MKTILLLAITSFLFYDLPAQEWSKTNGPYGGEIKDILVHPNGTVYALGGNPNQVIFRSTDNGNNWAQLTPSVMTNDTHRIIDLFLASDGTIYALGNSNLYKTADDGASWTKVNTGNGAASGGFDGGEEFAINKLSGTFYVKGYDYNDGKYTFFRSTNNGQTWTKGFQDLVYLSQIVVNSIGDVYALSAGETWKSTNDGSTFVRLASPVPVDILSYAVSLTAKSDGTQLAISTYNSTVFTLTAPFPSATWTAVAPTGITNPTSYGSNSKLLYSADNSTLFLFDNNNNKTYSRTTGSWIPGSTTFLTANGEDINCAASRDANNLYVGAQKIGVYKSINAGSGWTEVNTGIENLELNSIVVADNGNIIVSGSFAYRSSDQGQSWTKIATAENEYTVLKATTGSPKTLLLLAMGGGTSYKSVDNGVNWTTITSTPSNADNFVSPDGTKILAYGYNKLFYSSDQGVTWSGALTVSGLPASFTYNPTNNHSVVMDQNSIIYVYLYDYTLGSAGYKFYKIVPNSTTAPTTATATQIPFATIGINVAQDMKFMNNKVYMTGYGTSNDLITFTADGGASWIQKVIPNASHLDVDPVNNYIFITEEKQSNYTVHLSRDGANTFISSSIVQSTNYTRPYGVALDPAGVAYTGLAGSSVFKTKATVITPAAPSNLINSGSATDRITLSFDDNAFNEQYYVVEKFNGTSFDSLTRTGSTYSTGSKVYIEIANLQPNTSYQFKIYAQNEAGKSGDVTITTSTLEACTSTIPDNKSWSGSVNGTTLTNVAIKSLADGVYYISDVNNNLVTESTISEGVFSVGCTGTANKTYFYQNYPLVPDGNGTWNEATNTLTLKWHTEPWMSTQVAGVVTLVKNLNDPVPAAPLSAAAYLYNESSVQVNWTAVAFEKTFTIERKTGVGGTFLPIGTVQYPEHSFLDPGPLTLDQTYFYRIKSANGNSPTPGVSAYSNETQITFKKPNLILAETTVNTTPINSLGVLWADFNKDGFDDLVFTRFDLFSVNLSLPVVFQNDGAGNFTTVATNLEPSNFANGTAADYNNDGNLDLFYSTFRNLNQLYNGSGSLSFSRITPSPVEGTTNGDIEGAPFTASWVDFDNDGLLDLFVGLNGNFNSELYKQNPDHTFTKVTTAGELVTTPLQIFGMAWADYDNDRDQDVFIIDQRGSEPNKLFRNNNDGTFTKITGSVFDADVALEGQCASWADFDNDLDLDLFVGDQGGMNFLFRNNGNGTFAKLTTGYDVTNGGALGSNWLDINNDGFIDLLVVGQAGNSLFLNVNGTSFTRIPGEKITDTQLFCIAASSSDFNNDGFMDIALSRTSIQGEGTLGTPQNSLLFKNNNTTGKWLKVKLTGTVSNKSGIGTRIKVVTGTKNQIREVNAHIGLASQNSLTQHFGLGSATKADNVVVTWPSGIVQTLTNVDANSTITVTEDGTGPVITSRTPSVSATGVTVGTTILITFDEASIAVSGKKLKINEVSNPAIVVHDLDVTTATLSGNTYTFTLPSALEPSKNYAITLEAGAFKDIYGNEFSGVSSGAWTFTTADPPDTTPPVITFSPLASPVEKGFSPLTAGVTVTDDRNVATVLFQHRKIGEKNFQPLTLTFNSETGKWEGQVLNTFSDDMGFEYFIEASDGPNTARLPLDNTTYYKSTILFTAPPPAITLANGGSKTSWKIISIPHVLPTSQIEILFDALGLPGKTTWRMIRYTNTPAEAWLEYPTNFSSVERGKGYFINTKTGNTIELANASAPGNTRDNLFELPLVAGWNQIGNPYTLPVNWADVKAYNASAKIGDLLKFNGSYINNDQQLLPMQGGFVFAESAVTIKIPFAGQITSGGRSKGFAALGSDISAGEWALSFQLQQGDLSYNLGSIGMAADATISFDSYDASTPPRFFDYLELNFSHPEHFAKRFTRDIVPAMENYTWSFTVDSNLEGMAELKWDNAPLMSSGKDLFLLDISAQKIVNMKETGKYMFDPKESSGFKVYYGENLNVAPEQVQLGKAYPNPTNGFTAIAFSLPETGGLNQSVSLDVMDSMGRKVGTLKQGSLNPGYHEAVFDASEMMKGFYTCRLTVKNRNGQTTAVNKLIIK